MPRRRFGGGAHIEGSRTLGSDERSTCKVVGIMKISSVPPLSVDCHGVWHETMTKIVVDHVHKHNQAFCNQLFRQTHKKL